MLIKPETYKLWKEALDHFKNSDELKKAGELTKASHEAIHAFLLGQRAIYELSKELKMPDLTEVANNALHDFFERYMPSEGGKHYTPKETIEWARNTLKRLSAELPTDTFEPFRY